MGLVWAWKGNEHVLGICWGPDPVHGEVSYGAMSKVRQEGCVTGWKGQMGRVGVEIPFTWLSSDDESDLPGSPVSP